VLEPERQPLAKVHELARDARRERLELVVPLGGEEHLVAAAQEPGARDALHLARLDQQRAAVLARADAFGAQPAANGPLLALALLAFEHRDRGELVVREQVAGVHHFGDSGVQAAEVDGFAHGRRLSIRPRGRGGWDSGSVNRAIPQPPAWPDSRSPRFP